MVFGKRRRGDRQSVPVPDLDLALMLLARRIAELREARGLTQEDVADRIGTAVKNYQRIESGRQNLTVRTLVRIAHAIGVEPIAFWDPPASTRRQRGRPKGRRGALVGP